MSVDGEKRGGEQTLGSRSVGLELLELWLLAHGVEVVTPTPALYAFLSSHRRGVTIS